eukprot:m.134240 g.134240  ORF g.134240 m.134240 type:complete len:462 (+) comp29726_c0_seq1:197-1582(+)
MEHKLVYTEISSSTSDVGATEYYIRNRSDDRITVIPKSKQSMQGLRTFLTQAFLPQGYPDSVSPDYVEYQCWDTAQAFASSITGTLATHATLTGLGVGSDEATAASATVTYLMKDGTGMVGRILFAWAKGTDLDNNAKKWRLSADILNDIAIFVEILAPGFPQYFVLLNCLSSVAKSIVGVAGGATRAAMTQHQARANNSADVSAKDGSQETMVNLTALGVSFMIVPLVAGHTLRTWGLFILFTLMHIYSNYRAVSSLMLDQFNYQRMLIATREYFSNNQQVPTPREMATLEPIFLNTDFGLPIRLGQSFHKTFVTHSEFEAALGSSFATSKHLINLNFSPPSTDFATAKISVMLHTDASSTDVLHACFEALIVRMVILNERNKHMPSEFESIATKLNALSSHGSHATSLVGEVRAAAHRYANRNFSTFLERSRRQGWSVEKNQLDVSPFRGRFSCSGSKT